jgi:hypothetical protein
VRARAPWRRLAHPLLLPLQQVVVRVRATASEAELLLISAQARRRLAA